MAQLLEIFIFCWMSAIFFNRITFFLPPRIRIWMLIPFDLASLLQSFLSSINSKIANRHIYLLVSLHNTFQISKHYPHSTGIQISGRWTTAFHPRTLLLALFWSSWRTRKVVHPQLLISTIDWIVTRSWINRTLPAVERLSLQGALVTEPSTIRGHILFHFFHTINPWRTIPHQVAQDATVIAEVRQSFIGHRDPAPSDWSI